MDAVLRNIWVLMCCCYRLPANKIQTVNTSCRIQRLLKTNIITLHNSLEVHVQFRIRKKVFIFYIYLKRMGLNLSTNLPMFVYTFQAMWRHRPLKEYQFLLEFALHLLPLVYILWHGITPKPQKYLRQEEKGSVVTGTSHIFVSLVTPLKL